MWKGYRRFPPNTNTPTPALLQLATSTQIINIMLGLVLARRNVIPIRFLYFVFL